MNAVSSHHNSSPRRAYLTDSIEHVNLFFGFHCKFIHGSEAIEERPLHTSLRPHLDRMRNLKRTF